MINILIKLCWGLQKMLGVYMMRAFIAKLSDFFCIYKKTEGTIYFDDNISQYVIPKYQREYKWSEDKVEDLIRDVDNRDKFLGNIILDKKNNDYEIVDGQQRITTVYLILIALFNLLKNKTGDSLNSDQTYILSYLKKNNKFVLMNESIGDFITESNNTLNIDIQDNSDVYFQKNTFISLYKIISDELMAKDEAGKTAFIKKLLDCSFLILINEGNNLTASIQQIFIDINIKSQLLDVEDMFKGYCFENWWPQYHDRLKEQWIELKKNSKVFTDFGYKDMSEFLYHYLLSKEKSYEISQNLKLEGKHYLYNKTNTETEKIIKNMVSYSQDIVLFWNNLNSMGYNFKDLCPDSTNYLTTHECENVKELFRNIIGNRAAQYQKFPLLMLIHYIKKEPSLSAKISWDNFKKIATNYYVYSFLFINSKNRKQKASIDHTIFNILYDKNNSKIDRVNTAIKNLRKSFLDSYEQPIRFNAESICSLCSIIDFYNLQQNYLPMIYSFDEDYSREHFIINANRGNKVMWVNEGNSFEFALNNIDNITTFKNATINYLIIKNEINALLGHNDIVEKIRQLREYFNGNIPKYIGLYLDHIENMESYKYINALKGGNESQEVVKEKYIYFINDYFSERNQTEILQIIAGALKGVFVQ